MNQTRTARLRAASLLLTGTCMVLSIGRYKRTYRSPPAMRRENRRLARLLASVIVPRTKLMQMITMGQMRRNCSGSNDDHLVIVGITGRMVT
jgi:hypothetical protein